jgi:hypothetical protein
MDSAKDRIVKPGIKGNKIKKRKEGWLPIPLNVDYLRINTPYAPSRAATRTVIMSPTAKIVPIVGSCRVKFVMPAVALLIPASAAPVCPDANEERAMSPAPAITPAKIRTITALAASSIRLTIHITGYSNKSIIFNHLLSKIK